MPPSAPISSTNPGLEADAAWCSIGPPTVSLIDISCTGDESGRGMYGFRPMAVADESLTTALVIAAGEGFGMDIVASTIVGTCKWEGVGAGRGVSCSAYQVELTKSSFTTGGELVLVSELNEDAVDNSRIAEAGDGSGRRMLGVVFGSTEIPVPAFVLEVCVDE
jgi:hypothetical protein